MALRHDELNPDESARQKELERSWQAAQESLADPQFRAYLEEAIDRVNASDAKPISGEQFLARTESPTR